MFSAIGVRRSVGVCGLILPIALGPVGWFAFGVPFQENMSSYVHTPLRDVFVGLLFSIGVLLFIYRGRDRLENWTANLASAFAIGLALFPLDPGSDPLAQRSLVGFLHTVCGAGFFLVLAVYSLWHFPTRRGVARRGAPLPQSEQETVVKSPDAGAASDDLPEPHQAQRNLVYRLCGVVILLSMTAMAGYLVLLPIDWKVWANRWHMLFWFEWVAVWAFSAAWLTKGRAILTDLAIEWMAMTQDRLMAAVKPRAPVSDPESAVPEA